MPQNMAEIHDMELRKEVCYIRNNTIGVPYAWSESQKERDFLEGVKVIE
jgi:hypothetical protein